MRFDQGRFGPYPTAAETVAYQFGPAERARLPHHRGRVVSGTPPQVRARLLELAADYEVEELLITGITADFQDRLRSYELLAEAFELAPAGQLAAEAALVA